jgi:tRNA(Ile)-lysidine synthase
MDLLRSFLGFVYAERLFSNGDRLLVAVSGGMDSVVLCELCHRAGIEFRIAHCNFRLRGTESDRDEDFVRRLGARYGKEVLVKRFDTASYAVTQKLTIQVAARELRYEWFLAILDEDPSLACLATAHHRDDNIETALMNFFKGTGIAGLRAMQPKHGKIIRPLLFAPREDIARFARENGLEWMEDSSNLSDKYTRNYVRHRLMPVLEEIYPGSVNNLGENLNRFREIEVLYLQAVEQQKKKLLEYRGQAVHIPVLKLRKTVPLMTMVFEIIRDFGFTPHQAQAVIGLMDSDSGKYILSATHRILKDRNWLIISPCSSPGFAPIVIEDGDREIRFSDGRLQISKMQVDNTAAAGENGLPAAVTGSDGNIAWLDSDLMRFPLLLRKWKAGDYFYPLGMRKKKKLARFFIDKKLSLDEKEKVWVLEMDRKIVWVLGMRIDDRYRVTGSTREMLRIAAGPAGMP